MATMAAELKKQMVDQPGMELLKWKTRIAALWIIYVVNFAAYLILTAFEGMASRQNGAAQVVTDATRVAVAIFFLVPSILAWLSLTLKDMANRWTNFVFGILFSIPIILTVLSSKMSTVAQIKSLADFVLSLLIVWYAWKWPKREA